MAEPANSNRIEQVATSPGEFLIRVKEFDAMGKATEISVPMPTVVSFRQWSLMQQAVFLKKGTWNKQSLHEIALAIAYADNMGVDIMQGDVYPVGEGRISLSNKAKIKLALATGKVMGIHVAFTELKDEAPDECILEHDLECTATIQVQGWEKPIVRTERLSRWFKAKNPNWCDNPEHMLELNTVAHACEYVAPGATYDDEFATMAAHVAEGEYVGSSKSSIAAELRKGALVGEQVENDLGRTTQNDKDTQ